MKWMPQSIFPALFQASSAATGTGFTTIPVQSWPSAFILLAIGLMLVGGSAGSTSGGIKLYRLVVLAKLAGWSVTRVLLPREARLPPIRYDSEEVAEWEIKEMFGFLLMYFSVFFLTGLALSLGGYPIVDSLFESASALGTVGLSSGITSADAPMWVKLLLIFQMWVGRLEIIPVLVLLHPGIWNLRRSLR